jgi:hypothetical protein
VELVLSPAILGEAGTRFPAQEFVEKNLRSSAIEGEKHPAGAKEAAKKLKTFGEIGGMSIAGAEARVDSNGFSGTTEVVPLLQSLLQGVFPQPVKRY